MKFANPKTIVFITGAFVSHRCWDPWIAFYESKGYTCIAPPWPFKDAPAADLRNRQPNDSDLARLRFSELLDYYVTVVKEIPEKPIAIGHSLGGLLVQLLVNRDLVLAGVAIHSVPPQGVSSFSWSMLRSIWKPLGFFSSKNKTHLMSLNEWKYAFTNGMSKEDQAISYHDNAIPESKRVLRDTLTKVAAVDFNKTHPPLLFIAGSDDNIIPETLNYANYLRYDKNHSVTDYKSFEGKNHFVLGLPSWHDEADYILSWFEILQH